MTARLDEALADFEHDRRMMFGGPAHFVNGNMFAVVLARSVVLRLSEEAGVAAGA